MTEANVDSDAAIQTLLDAGAAAVPVTYIEGSADDGPVAALVTVPTGYEVRCIDLAEQRDPYRAQPRRKRGTVHVHTVDALVAYHEKHASNSAEVWIGDDAVIDVLNAHESDAPEWQDHRAFLKLRFSPEWKRWTDVSGKLFGQAEFAEFLEGAAVDVTEPDMATMLEVAQSLEATTRVDFESAYRTQDGQRAFKYKETTSAKAGQSGELEIPNRLLLSLRVFEGQEAQPIAARFRYRITGDGLRLGVVIDRIPELLEHARLGVAQEIETRIDRGVVFAGTP